MNTSQPISCYQRLAAGGVHLLTASATILALFTLSLIAKGHYITACWLMAISVLIDSVDGTLARACHVKVVMPKVDGALMDNIVDYMNYVLCPCYFLLLHPTLLPVAGREIIVSLILLASAYQFTQVDAKTTDHFFKGFPSYWNIVVFYQFVLMINPVYFAAILIVLCAFVFIPIKYVYLSRMDFLTSRAWVKHLIMAGSIVYGLVIAALLLIYPYKPDWMLWYLIAYVVVYFLVSLYATLCLPEPADSSDHEVGS